MNAQVSEIAKILGGAETLNRELSGYADLRRAIEEGFPAEAASNTLNQIVSSNDKKHRDVFKEVVFATPDRMAVINPDRVNTARLSIGESERTERIARIYSLAERALGDAVTARQFMTTPLSRLSHEAPLQVLKTEVGALQVEEILNAVMFGLPA